MFRLFVQDQFSKPGDSQPVHPFSVPDENLVPAGEDRPRVNRVKIRLGTGTATVPITASMTICTIYIHILPT
jgi:hypothetical protein